MTTSGKCRGPHMEKCILSWFWQVGAAVLVLGIFVVVVEVLT